MGRIGGRAYVAINGCTRQDIAICGNQGLPGREAEAGAVIRVVEATLLLMVEVLGAPSGGLTLN